MKRAVATLGGPELDAGVAKLQGWAIGPLKGDPGLTVCTLRSVSLLLWELDYSKAYILCGPLIEKMKPSFQHVPGFGIRAQIRNGPEMFGDTYVIAFCRALVAYEVGLEVDL